jgi:DNA-binding NarL/FixJ family response regulator
MSADIIGVRPVTIVVGRFDPLLGRGLAAMLGDDERIRVLASDVADAKLERVIAHLLPRVAIVAGTLDHSVLVRLRSDRPDTGVVVLAIEPERLYGTSLLAAGATCVAGNTSSAQLVAAVRCAAQGEPTFFGADGARVARGAPSKGLLTPREIEVFEHLAKGRTYTRIGQALHVAPATARTHTLSICRKLGVENKRELIGRSLDDQRS